MAKFGQVPTVDAVAAYDEAGKLAVFLVNRSVDEAIDVSLDTSRTPVGAVLEALSLYDEDRLAVNSAEHPDRVTPRVNDSVQVDEGTVTVTLPPISWTALSLST